MFISQLIITFLTIGSIVNFPTDKHPLAKTPWGLVQGKYIEVNKSRRVAAFLGIPYTLPPVGPLRFERTHSLPDYPFHPINHYFNHHQTSKPIKADSFQSACIQNPIGYQKHAGNVSLSENCLYLNIFTPTNNRSKLFNEKKKYPVFVYVHGSAFAFGGPASIHNQVQYLASYGDIMVVTIAHRLAFFGQAYDGPVSEESLRQPHKHDRHLPSNQYLHDVIQSLQWVHDNIHHFGGNPDQVTLGGLSAGAIISTAIFVSPFVPNGIFNKVVAMSGLPIYPPTVLSPYIVKRTTRQALESVNCSSRKRNTETNTETNDETFTWSEVNCLKRVDPFSLVSNRNDLFYYPMHGDNILPKPPQQLIKTEQFKKKGYSILIGTEQMEDVISLGYSPKSVDDAINWLINRYEQQMQQESIDDLTSIIKSYFNELNYDQLNNATMVEITFHQILSDFAFICPSLLMGKIFSRANQVYFYRNHLILDGNKYNRPLGTVHADDSALFIGYPFLIPDSYSDSDREISLQMIKLLGSFVKGSEIPWPAVQAESEKVIPNVWKITNPINYTNYEIDPFSKRCSEWAAIYSIEDL